MPVRLEIAFSMPVTQPLVKFAADQPKTGPLGHVSFTRDSKLPLKNLIRVRVLRSETGIAERVKRK